MRKLLSPPPPSLETPAPERLFFCLGGRDLEMVEIAGLVRAALGDARLADRGLGWGCGASAYRDEIAAAVAAGLVPALVELVPDMPLPAGAILIDHHDERAGEPCSLAQAFALLRRPAGEWTRERALVCANDAGHVEGLRALGADAAEIARVRARDRAAQGVTAQDEEQGRRALACAERPAPGVLLVRLPHERTAAVTDPLAEEGAGPDILLVETPRALHVFGPGDLVARLRRAFGGFAGGELPRRGFWGLSPGVHKRDGGRSGGDRRMASGRRERDGIRTVFHDGVQKGVLSENAKGGIVENAPKRLGLDRGCEGVGVSAHPAWTRTETTGRAYSRFLRRVSAHPAWTRTETG